MEPHAPGSEIDREPTSAPLAGAAASDPLPAEPVERIAESSEPSEGRAEPPPQFLVEPAAVSAVASRSATRSSGPLRLFGYLLAAIFGVVVTVAVLAGSGSIGAASADPTASPMVTPTVAPTPAPTFALDGSAMGVASAPVTIEIWADFQCPYCGLLAHGIEPSLVREMAVTGKARIDYRDFAFLGQESTDAAVAAKCAEREGMFWRFHDLLYASQSGENQGAFARDRLLGLASFAGIADTAAFTACLDDPAVAGRVAAETAEGRSHGVESTPTIRITGPGPTQLIKGVTELADIAAAIDKASTPAPVSSPGPISSSGPGSSPDPVSSIVPSPSSP